MLSLSLVYCQVLANLALIPIVKMSYGGVVQPENWMLVKLLGLSSSRLLGSSNDGRQAVCHWVTFSFTVFWTVCNVADRTCNKVPVSGEGQISKKRCWENKWYLGRNMREINSTSEQTQGEYFFSPSTVTVTCKLCQWVLSALVCNIWLAICVYTAA